MADGSHKAIERVAVGDWVMGLTGPVQVYATEAPVLGGRTYLRMEDGSLFWSAEHLFWVQRDGAEYFGSHDKEEYEYEMKLGILVGLTSATSGRSSAVSRPTPTRMAGSRSGWWSFRPPPTCAFTT